ncbi:hypothetical protein SCLCIDRAFT_879938 [Scleroderma citrinum Foug A]|uniref:Uncharacterized protein n=1 Tax=Scleroderma citrinum Foug A TaxID=1036808 RepID=A0A0C3A4G4_9AGAM|nr:hypothetical protein SCLCIDRAFT_879938 [Scleroderma citrinum Foug A]
MAVRSPLILKVPSSPGLNHTNASNVSLGRWCSMSVCMEYPATSAVSLDAQISYSHPQDHPAHVSGVCASCSNLQVQWI